MRLKIISGGSFYEKNRLIKSITALALALVIVVMPVANIPFLQELCITARAETTSDGNFDYTVENDEVTITKCNVISDDVVIPAEINGKTVVAIGKSAFYDKRYITSVTIPDSVTSIGDWSFYYCKSLISVNFPDNLISIGDFAFLHCESLPSVTIPDSVESIGISAFSGCKNCNSISIPDREINIGPGAFSGCESLTSVTIPDSMTSISSAMFRDCTSLTSVTIPDSVTSIEGYAFCHCNSLTSITIPDSVTSIGEYAFTSCLSFEAVTIPNSVTSIGDFAFYGCYNCKLMNIPSSVTSIGNGAFKLCYNSLKIIYDGTEEQWNDIVIGDDNQPLIKATKIYIRNITFDANGGMVTPAAAVTSGGKLASLPIPERENYNFGGWFENENCTGTAVTIDKEYLADTTLYAMWIEKHTHSYGTEWKTDSTNHWHECSCGDKKDTVAHTENVGVITTAPTTTTEGTKTYSCSVCGYVMRTETVDKLPEKHTHDYGTEWRTDSTEHWHECICGDKKDTVAHTENAGVITTAPTTTTEGTKTYSCSICGYVTRTETIDKLPEENTGDDGSVTGRVELVADEGTLAINVAPASQNDLINSVKLTGEEQAAYANGDKFEVVLVVKSLASDSVPAEDKTLVEAEAKKSGNDIEMFIDLMLFLKNTTANKDRQITEADGSITIVISIPNEIYSDDKTYSVIRVHNGKYENIGGVLDRENRTLTFSTDKFSTYAIISKKVSAETDTPNIPAKNEIANPNTGDCSFLIAAWLLMMVSLLGAAVMMLSCKKES